MTVKEIAELLDDRIAINEARYKKIRAEVDILPFSSPGRQRLVFDMLEAASAEGEGREIRRQILRAMGVDCV